MADCIDDQLYSFHRHSVPQMMVDCVDDRLYSFHRHAGPQSVESDDGRVGWVGPSILLPSSLKLLSQSVGSVHTPSIVAKAPQSVGRLSQSVGSI